MGSNKTLFYFLLGYILLIILFNTFLFLKIREFNVHKEMTAHATASVRFCYNRPPTLNYTCNSSVYQNDEFYCIVNRTDPDNDSLFFEISFINSDNEFDILSTGIINFTPNSSQVKNYSFRITAWDSSGCENGLVYLEANLTVINVNDPPILIKPIENQSWYEDTSLTAFDLDNYFYDPDGDPINYTYTILNNIRVDIDEQHSVTFTSIDGWSGTDQIIFFAWDPYYANTSSNNVTLRVIEVNEQEPIVSPPSSSSGSGGSSGLPPMCLPKWYCRPWGNCEPDNFMRRECYDLNNCSSELGKPNVTETCEFISTCYDGFKGPEEEGIDCGGPCPPCGSCYDELCNNKEDCVFGLTTKPDCGGPCKACVYVTETCYDGICNNNEDCTLELTDLPDCGGPCDVCPVLERPALVKALNWTLIVMLFSMVLVTAYLIKKTYPSLQIISMKKRKRRYEEKLLLETKISESIYNSILKLEEMLGKEDIEKLIMLFSTIIRRYFKNLLNIKFEFTYEELISDIKSRNISPTLKNVLKEFFERSTELEFSGKSVSKEELMAMISEFKQIVSYTSKEPIVKEEKKDKSNEKVKTRVDAMFLKVSEAETALRKEALNDAYFIYLGLVHDYKVLSERDKKKINGYISRLYEEIKLAREKIEYQTT